MSKARSMLYRWARLMGDVESLSSPTRFARRMTNRVIGKHLVSRLYLRSPRRRR